MLENGFNQAIFHDGLSSIFAYSLALLLAANALAALAQSLLQFSTMLPRSHDRACVVQKPQQPLSRPKSHALVSIHVPIHEEPPHIVIATLMSLARLEGADFEVLVIDNNTRDRATWMPVRNAVAQLGKAFRFYHFDDVLGAKAGALNLALGLADRMATHIAIVDADYQVNPSFIADAVEAIAIHGVDYVQFPQSYRGVSERARGVECELGDYFACFAAAEGRSGSLLPTGTLSVFKRGALERVGGWSDATITEDADIGVRLHATAHKGLWVARDCGSGLLPLDFDGLKKQRARWVSGNIQVLRKAFRTARRLRLNNEELVVLVQLTAWVSLWLLPAIGLAIAALWHEMAAANAIAGIAAGTIIGSAMLTSIRMFMAMPAGNRRASIWRAALTTKLALTWTQALAWLPALSDRPLAFHRTLKQKTSPQGRKFGLLPLVSLLFVGIAGIYAAHDNVLAALACALLASIWPCSLVVDANLRASAQRSAELA